MTENSQRPPAFPANKHKRRVDVRKILGPGPDKLRRIHLDGRQNAGKQTHENRGEQNIAARVFSFLG